MPEIQKDLVLSPNEYAYVLDETKGNVACNVGPHKMSLSQSDNLVKFDTKTKKFIPCDRYNDAISLFVTAPEGWYIALKNPAPGNKHPQAGTSNSIPENMEIGKKINIPGPASFALYPGQMAQVIQGHNLRSNQYLVAKVYDADSLNTTKEDRDASENEPYFVNGQVLIIKGTEISFYIPPTGIEVKAINNDPSKGYVRDAVTLERLEYCILKDEDGNKRYVHGPTVVFPEPTESFIKDGNGHIKRNAIELSDISGVYVKVVADYKDDNGKEHKAGEELFITGKDQMIYYPRPEHTFITYNGKVMHHAVAIPKGEGRYIMNRMTGEIKTVRGPRNVFARS
jgi:major vault protein